ncbi:hypothetical protein [Catellatospora coxensis]|uniref:hypothetical protein n=1 Tax=Catellatospora coxensis TaxID=310354 RepID=UPI001943BA1D|nr:hypothetical protein [Catellatospora coxensis]
MRLSLSSALISFQPVSDQKSQSSAEDRARVIGEVSRSRAQWAWGGAGSKVLGSPRSTPMDSA